MVRSTALSRRRILRGKTCRERCPKIAIIPGNEEEAHNRGVRRTQFNLGHDFEESAASLSQRRPHLVGCVYRTCGAAIFQPV